MRLEHRRFGNMACFFEALEGECNGGADFIDGVAFGPGEIHLNTGRFVGTAPYVSDYSFEHVYYRSIRDRESDYLTAHDFIWRWDTDWFWCSKNLGAQIPWVRRLYGPQTLGSRTISGSCGNSRRGLTKTFDRLRGMCRVGDGMSTSRSAMRQPSSTSSSARLESSRCGSADDRVRIGRSVPALQARAARLYVNFGFWDVVRRRARFAPHHFNRMIGDKVVALGGIKSLYSRSFFSRRRSIGRTVAMPYRGLKTKYDPDGALSALRQVRVACLSGGFTALGRLRHRRLGFHGPPGDRNLFPGRMRASGFEGPRRGRVGTRGRRFVAGETSSPAARVFRQFSLSGRLQARVL